MNNFLSNDQKEALGWGAIVITLVAAFFLAFGLVMVAIRGLTNMVIRPAPVTAISTSTTEILYTRCSKVDRETVGLVGTDLIALDSKDDTLCVLNREFKFEVAVPGQPVQVPVQATTTKP